MSVIIAGETRKSHAGSGRSASSALEQLVELTGREAELWIGSALEGEAARRRRLEQAATVLLGIRGQVKALRAAALYREVLAEPAADPQSLVLDEPEVEAEPVAQAAPAVHRIARTTLDRKVATVLSHTMVASHFVVTLELAPTDSPEDFTHAVRVFREDRPIVDGVIQAPVLHLVQDVGYFSAQAAGSAHAREEQGLRVDAALRGIGVRAA